MSTAVGERNILGSGCERKERGYHCDRKQSLLDHLLNRNGILMTLAALTPGTWTLDPTHSTVSFVARHLMISKVRGTFDEFTAEVTIGEDPLASTLTAEVQMVSVNTGNADRDNHLRANDFFDVANHPTMKLVSTGFSGSGDTFTMTADLTIRGVTQSVSFDLEFSGVGGDPWGGTRAGFTATTSINRKDFGVEWNAPLETGGVMLGEKVQIELDVQLVRA
jgi:polyisoprenoid-binding protein YceI